MNYKRVFLPIGGGDELKERIYGALLVAKYFKVHLEILKSYPSVRAYNTSYLPEKVLQQLQHSIEDRFKYENDEFQSLLFNLAKELDVEISPEYFENKVTVSGIVSRGERSSLVAQESKFYDLVVAAIPPQGEPTATFEAAVYESGKPILMIPRIMTSFKTQKIIIGWNNSQEATRTVTLSIPILKQAKEVHIVSSKEYAKEADNLNKLQIYLSTHGIKTSSELIKTTIHPGEGLLNAALDGNFDLIVAGAYGRKGFKELMFGGATSYFLKHTTLPVFMSH